MNKKFENHFTEYDLVEFISNCKYISTETNQELNRKVLY